MRHRLATGAALVIRPPLSRVEGPLTAEKGTRLSFQLLNLAWIGP